MFWFTLAFFSLVFNVVTDMHTNFIKSREIILAATNDWAKKKSGLIRLWCWRAAYSALNVYFLAFTAHFLWIHTAEKYFVRTQLWTKFTLKSGPCALWESNAPQLRRWPGSSFFFTACTEIELFYRTVLTHKRIIKQILISALKATRKCSKYFML